MKKIRVLVVEDQTVLREGLISILSFQPDIEVVGQAEDWIEAVELVQQTKPEVILLDLVMPRQDDMAPIPKVKELAPEVGIIILTSFATPDRGFQTITAATLG